MEKFVSFRVRVFVLFSILFVCIFWAGTEYYEAQQIVLTMEWNRSQEQLQHDLYRFRMERLLKKTRRECETLYSRSPD